MGYEIDKLIIYSSNRLSWIGLTYDEAKKRAADKEVLLYFAQADIDENQMLDEFEIRRQDLKFKKNWMSEVSLFRETLNILEERTTPLIVVNPKIAIAC